MATWTELVDHVRATSTIDAEDENEFSVTLERAEGKAVRHQRVMARRYTQWAREMVEIRSAFGEIGAYDPLALLADNLNLPIGSVALHGKFLVLVQKACLDDLTVEAVVFLITRVSLLADVLEARYGDDRF